MVDSSSSRKSVLLVLASLVVVAAFVVPVVVFWPVHVGLKGAIVDSPKAPATDLSDLAIGATEYLVTLAAALFGLVGLMMSGKISDMPRDLSPKWRMAIAAGVVLLALSLWTGFTVHQLVLESAADAVVRYTLDRTLGLHLLQLVELAAAVILIGSAIIWRAILKR